VRQAVAVHQPLEAAGVQDGVTSTATHHQRAAASMSPQTIRLVEEEATMQVTVVEMNAVEMAPQLPLARQVELLEADGLVARSRRMLLYH
jgi:hypothetical protein